MCFLVDNTSSARPALTGWFGHCGGIEICVGVAGFGSTAVVVASAVATPTPVVAVIQTAAVGVE